MYKKLESEQCNNVNGKFEANKMEKGLHSDDVNVAYANFINTFNALYNLH